MEFFFINRRNLLKNFNIGNDAGEEATKLVKDYRVPITKENI